MSDTYYLHLQSRTETFNNIKNFHHIRNSTSKLNSSKNLLSFKKINNTTLNNNTEKKNRNNSNTTINFDESAYKYILKKVKNKFFSLSTYRKFLRLSS